MRLFLESVEYHGPAKLHFCDGSILTVLVWIERNQDSLEGEILSDLDPSYFSELADQGECVLEFHRSPLLRVIFPDPSHQRFEVCKQELAT